MYDLRTSPATPDTNAWVLWAPEDVAMAQELRSVVALLELRVYLPHCSRGSFQTVDRDASRNFFRPHLTSGVKTGKVDNANFQKPPETEDYRAGRVVQPEILAMEKRNSQGEFINGN